MEPIKYAWDQLNDIAQLELTQAITKHRVAEPGLGYPYAFWTAYERDVGTCTCAEYYDPETGKTRWWHYHKRDDGSWEWF